MPDRDRSAPHNAADEVDAAKAGAVQQPEHSRVADQRTGSESLRRPGPEVGPTTARMWVAVILRELRAKSGLTQNAAAALVGMTGHALSRHEAGTNMIRYNDARRLLTEVYEVTDPQLDAILELVRLGNKRGVKKDLKRAVPQLLGALVGLEVDANRFQAFEPTLVPGLLQTQRYARALLQAGHRAGLVNGDEIDTLVAARMARADRIFRREDPPECWVILCEAVLDREVGGPEVMAEQLQHIIDMASSGAVTVQVLKNDVGAHAAMNTSFALLTFQRAPHFRDLVIAYHDWLTGSVYPDDPDDVELYRRAFQHLIKDSTPDTDALGVIRQAKEKYERARTV